MNHVKPKPIDQYENGINTKYLTFNSFLEQLAENPSSVFTNLGQRKWLKIDLITYDGSWQSLFEPYDLEKQNEMYYFKMQQRKVVVEYYVYEIETGILIFFSMSNRKDHNTLLNRFIKRTRGITNLWSPFNSFDDTIRFITSKYQAKIYSFTAHNMGSSKLTARIRSDVNRSIKYSGNDSNYSLGELRENYGVLPFMVDFKIESSKIRITNNGFLLIRNVNLKILRIVEEIIAQSIIEPNRLCNISKQILCKHEKWNGFKIPKIMSAKIVFNKNPDTVIINELFKTSNFNKFEENVNLPRFSYINANLSDTPLLNYSATAVDEDKGTIFGVSGNSKQLVLIPKHKITFESFFNFYRLINEVIDESSVFLLFNEQYKQ